MNFEKWLNSRDRNKDESYMWNIFKKINMEKALNSFYPFDQSTPTSCFN